MIFTLLALLEGCAEEGFEKNPTSTTLLPTKPLKRLSWEPQGCPRSPQGTPKDLPKPFHRTILGHKKQPSTIHGSLLGPKRLPRASRYLPGIEFWSDLTQKTTKSNNPTTQHPNHLTAPQPNNPINGSAGSRSVYNPPPQLCWVGAC